MSNKHKVEISLTLEGEDAIALLRVLGTLGTPKKVLKPVKVKEPTKEKKPKKSPKPKKVKKTKKAKEPSKAGVTRPRSRPRGRPPKGKVWDAKLGKYVPKSKYN
tara:strand:+ start:327 stop:638 length:312 start_codon:yes stop_codon:yes gene_type:complete